MFRLCNRVLTSSEDVENNYSNHIISLYSTCALFVECSSCFRNIWIFILKKNTFSNHVTQAAAAGALRGAETQFFLPCQAGDLIYHTEVLERSIRRTCSLRWVTGHRISLNLNESIVRFFFYPMLCHLKHPIHLSLPPFFKGCFVSVVSSLPNKTDALAPA